MLSIGILALMSIAPIQFPATIAQTNTVTVTQVVREYDGFAAYYSPGVMEMVARNRKLPAQQCMIASPLESIGTWVTVSSAKGGAECFVMDVAAARDRDNILRRGIVVELDWNTARRLCNTRLSPRECPVRVQVK